MIVKYVVATHPEHRIINGNPVNTCKFIKKVNKDYVETDIEDFIKHVNQGVFTWQEIKNIPRDKISEKAERARLHQPLWDDGQHNNKNDHKVNT